MARVSATREGARVPVACLVVGLAGREVVERQRGVARHHHEHRTIAAGGVEEYAVQRIAHRAAERHRHEIQRREDAPPGRGNRFDDKGIRIHRRQRPARRGEREERRGVADVGEPVEGDETGGHQREAEHHGVAPADADADPRQK